MLKTLSAALVAASVLLAPIAASAETAPATRPATTTTKVVKVKGHKHHVVRHHTRIKSAKHVRGHKKIVTIKKTRHGKIVKAHKHPHVAFKAVKSPKVAN
jgi:Ni/Co efflux regulator RcnB